MEIDLLKAIINLDGREKKLNETIEMLQRHIEALATSSEEDRMEKLSIAVMGLRLLQSRWKGLRTAITGEDTPLGDVPMPPLSTLGITEH